MSTAVVIDCSVIEKRWLSVKSTTAMMAPGLAIDGIARGKTAMS